MLLLWSSRAIRLLHPNLIEFIKKRQGDELRADVKIYQEILASFPGDVHACEAQFMIGFVYAEELNDFDLAREALAEIVEGNMECTDDLRDSAKWMLENMGKEPPEFEEG